MKSAEEVTKLISNLKEKTNVLSDVAWETALACVGWPYVFGGRGEYCTPSNRRARYTTAHPTIKSACKNYEGEGSCSGCKWYPGSKKVRFFDCRGFTYWILLQVYGWKLQGAGATSQWNCDANWKSKGEISSMPKNTLCCLFVKKDSKMEHTGFGLNNETVECSSGVQHFTKRSSKWTHWAVPVCIDQLNTIPTNTNPTTTTENTTPTLKRGSKGKYVTLLQTSLVNRGYSVGKCGIDGDFGKDTEAAVKKFQTDNGLPADGIVGEKTWKALEGNTKPVEKYTIHITGLTASQAKELVSKYPGAAMTKE